MVLGYHEVVKYWSPPMKLGEKNDKKTEPRSGFNVIKLACS
jgi:hypothetical protein